MVETGPAAAVFAPPYHPYTQVLLAAVPSLGRARPTGDLTAADPAQPAVVVSPQGCRFSGRCGHRIPGVCETSTPPIRDFASGRHRIACHLPPDRLPNGVFADTRP